MSKELEQQATALLKKAGTTSQNFRPAKEWDDIYATYYWYIHLDPKHPDNSTSLLTGYSKKNNQKEASDKVQMLKRKIVNLFNNGYFKRITKIEIKMRVDDWINKKYDPIILELFPTHYNIPEANHDYTYKNFGTFLHEFYEAIRTRQPMDKVLPPAKRTGASQDDFLNIHARNHSTVAHLYSYASRLSRNGHAQGAVDDYIRKYKDLKQWK